MSKDKKNYSNLPYVGTETKKAVQNFEEGIVKEKNYLEKTGAINKS